MSAGRYVFFFFFFLFGCLAMAMMAGGTGNAGAEGAAPTVELSKEQQHRKWAAEQGKTLFLYDVAGAEGYALCKGTSYIVKLPPGKDRTVELTSDEALNLSLCKRNPDTGNYALVQNIGGASPGDSLVWTGGNGQTSLAWTRYSQ